eukprot:gene61532-84165_t
MIRGKKIMQLFDDAPFDYLPGESVIVPANETMRIHFPEAEAENPSQCIALAVPQEQLQQTLNYLNDQYRKPDEQSSWSIAFNKYDEKSKAYYLAAARHFQGVKDSVLRAAVKSLVDSSMKLYAAQILPHKSLLKNIDSANVSLNDLFAALKIIKTLPIIADYQRNNLPDSTSLIEIYRRYALAGAKVDSTSSP